MTINRFAIATGGYQPGATYFRALIATKGYWNYIIETWTLQGQARGRNRLGTDMTMT